MRQGARFSEGDRISANSAVCPDLCCHDESAGIPLAGISLLDLLRNQVRDNPEGIAAVCGRDRLTYQALLSQSLSIAAHIKTLGIARDDCVGLFVEPSLDLMVGVWGVVCSGGAYLPLSPEYPEDRLRYMINDAGVSVIFTQEHLRDKARELAPPGAVIITSRDALDRPGEPGQNSAGGPQPHDLAYVIYTSGSTGKPKGVMVEHHAIAHQMSWLAGEFELGPGWKVLQKTPTSFDAAQWEILAPACGSTVVMGAPGIYRDPEQLIETIIEYGVTTLQCVPTLLQALLDTEDFGRCVSLRHLFSGGEALSWNLAAQTLKTLPGCGLVNLYGPTECTINAAAHRVDPARAGTGAVPIGTPATGTFFHILDTSLSPVAPGETGELYIGGAQLARGYLKIFS